MMYLFAGVAVLTGLLLIADIVFGVKEGVFDIPSSKVFAVIQLFMATSCIVSGAFAIGMMRGMISQ